MRTAQRMIATLEYPEAFKPFLGRLTAERQQKRKRSTRRMWSLDRLPLPRAFFTGPRWRSAFAVREIPIADIDPVAARLHRPGRKLLMFTLEEDVRELVTTGGWCQERFDEVRPGVFAMWGD